MPVGEPNIPITTGVRSHNRVLAPVDVALSSTDHDFHIAGLVPSVALNCNIPSNHTDSFFSGKAHVITKDKVFQASNPFRHAAELYEILCEYHLNDDLQLDRPVLAFLTDRGPDHRPTFETVKVALVALFISLNIDMLVALRTAPNNSWMNPAERVMSVLNLALQHCALSREPMQSESEKKMKRKGCMTAVRNLAEADDNFKKDFEQSVRPVIETVNHRFTRMSIKGVPLNAMPGLSDDAVEKILDPLKELTGADTYSTKSSSKDLRGCKELMAFLDSHCKSGNYCFQIKKCASNNCAHCRSSPVRMGEELHFLPDPQPSESPDAEHTYQQFCDVCITAYN